MNKKLWILAASALLAIFSTGCTPEDEPTEEPKAAPELTKITPAYGYAGDEAVITGANFSATASENEVYFGSDKAEVKTATATSLTVVVPGDEVETATKVDVTVKVDGQTSEALSFTYLAKEPEVLPISVSGINPTEGSAGTEVTISGENFGTSADGITVVFGANTAEIVSVTETAIVVTVPEGDGDVAVIVAKDGVDPSDPVMFKYVYAAVVEVESIYPTMRTEGEEITIIGTGFSTAIDDYTVTIGDVEATVSAVSETGINVVVPALAKGEYTVSIKMKGAATVETEAFVYWSLPSYTVSNIIGNGAAGFTTGVGTEVSVNIPEYVGWAPDGTLWITQRGGSTHHISSVNMSTMELTHVVDGATIGNYHPWGGDFNSKGEFHVACKSKNVLGKVVKGAEGYSWETYSLEGLETNFKSPMRVLFDDVDNMYIADRDNKRIVIAYEGKYSGEIALGYQPYTIAWDAKKENILVGTNGGYRILSVNVATKEVVTIAGSGTKPEGSNYSNGEVGNALTANLGAVTGINCDTDGYLYYCDQHNRAVQVLIPGVGGDYVSGMVRTIAGQLGVKGKANGDGLLEATINAPGMIVKDPSDNGLIFADGDGYYVVRKAVPVTE